MPKGKLTKLQCEPPLAEFTNDIFHPIAKACDNAKYRAKDVLAAEEKIKLELITVQTWQEFKQHIAKRTLLYRLLIDGKASSNVKELFIRKRRLSLVRYAAENGATRGVLRGLIKWSGNGDRCIAACMRLRPDIRLFNSSEETSQKISGDPDADDNNVAIESHPDTAVDSA